MVSTKKRPADVAYHGVWATRPDATGVPAGTVIAITDVGTGGYSQWYSDGTYWRPMNGCVVLHTMTTPLQSASTVNPSLDYPIYVAPAGLFFPGSNLAYTAGSNYSNASASAVSWEVSVDGSSALLVTTGSPTQRNRWASKMMTVKSDGQRWQNNAAVAGPGNGSSVTSPAAFDINIAHTFTGTLSFTDATPGVIDHYDFTLILQG